MTGSSNGRIITFYSYKGGTGRSMAVANTAWVLASNGFRVLMVDWDLEAPGLHRYFHPFLIDKKLEASAGVVDLVWRFSNAVMSHPEEEGSGDDWYREYADLRDFTISLDWKFDRHGGMLDLIPAGRQDASYASRVNSFDWENFYNRLGGGVFLEAVREDMRSRYDYVLIDSRTGVSDTSGICTVHMPDQLVVCFTLNTQSIEGASAVAKSVAGQRDGGFRIFPVPMRVEDGEKTKLERARDLAIDKFSSALSWLMQDEWLRYWGSVQVPYKVYYAYEEVLATFADTPMQTDSVLAAIEALSGYLAGAGTEMRLRPPQNDLRHKVLEQFERKAAPSPMRNTDTKPPYRIYISHAYRERELARALFDLLNGLFADRVVVILPSTKPISDLKNDYLNDIRDQISSCDAMIVVLAGRQDELSPWVSQEIGMATAFNKRLIPVMFADGREKIPAMLEKFQVFRAIDPEDMFRILEHLNLELDLYPEKVFQRASQPLLSDYLKEVNTLSSEGPDQKSDPSLLK